MLLLIGPSGCGKRALVHAAARELGVDVEEPAGIDSVAALLRVTTEGVTAHGLFATPSVWLFTGVDGYLTSDETSAMDKTTSVTAMRKLLALWTSKQSLPPIVITMHGFPDNNTMRVLRQSTTLPRVYFYPVKTNVAQTVLLDIGTRERIAVQDIGRVTRSFHGDLRHAILSLALRRPSPVTCRRPATPVHIQFTPAVDGCGLVRSLCLHLYVRSRNDSEVSWVAVQPQQSPHSCTIRVIGFTEYDISKCIKRVQADLAREFHIRRQEAMAEYDRMRHEGTVQVSIVEALLHGCVAEDVQEAVHLLQRHIDSKTCERDVQSDVREWLLHTPRVYDYAVVQASDANVHFEVRRLPSATGDVGSLKDLACDTPAEAATALLHYQHAYTDAELVMLYQSSSFVDKLLHVNTYVDNMSTDTLVAIADARRDVDLFKYEDDTAASSIIHLYLHALRKGRAEAKAMKPSYGTLQFPSPTGWADTAAALSDLRNDCVEFGLLTACDIADRLDVMRAHVRCGTFVDKDVPTYTCTDTTAAFMDGTYRAIGALPKHVTCFQPLMSSNVCEPDDSCIVQEYRERVAKLQLEPPNASVRTELAECLEVLRMMEE